MMKLNRVLGLALFTCVSMLCVIGGGKSWAAPIVIDPNDDGSIYSSGSVVTIQYLMASGTIQGVAEFSLSSITNPISSAYLSVNPYALPLWDSTVDIYGYASSDGVLTSADYNAGTPLGTLALPSGLGYGESVSFDVTGFLQGVASPYVGFNFRTSGTDVFSSLEYNLGRPAQLVVNTVPEPSTMLLLMSGVVGVVGVRRLRAWRA